MSVLLYGVSLFFAARIEELARAAGVTLAQAAASSNLAQEVERVRPTLVITELERIELAQVAALARRADLRGVRVIGFAAHVRDELIAQARQAGCDEVLAKGVLARRLRALFEE